MSLILDALQRSDRERRAGAEIPGLHTRHELAGRLRRMPGWRWAWLLAPALAILPLAYLLWPEPPAGGETAPALAGSAPAAVPPAPQPDAGPAPGAGQSAPQAPAGQAPLAPPRAAAPPGAAAGSPARAPGGGEPPNAVAALYESARPRPAAAGAQASAAEATAKAPPAAPAAETARAIDVEALARAARAELAAGEPRPHPVPLIGQLPQRAKDRIPTIYYQRHDWSSRPGESRVLLNRSVYREGEQVAPGLRLVEILEDAIVLNHEGRLFRLRALNSWVNL